MNWINWVLQHTTAHATHSIHLPQHLPAPAALAAPAGGQQPAAGSLGGQQPPPLAAAGAALGAQQPPPLAAAAAALGAQQLLAPLAAPTAGAGALGPQQPPLLAAGVAAAAGGAQQLPRLAAPAGAAGALGPQHEPPPAPAGAAAAMAATLAASSTALPANWPRCTLRSPLMLKCWRSQEPPSMAAVFPDTRTGTPAAGATAAAALASPSTPPHACSSMAHACTHKRNMHARSSTCPAASSRMHTYNAHVTATHPWGTSAVYPGSTNQARQAGCQHTSRSERNPPAAAAPADQQAA